MTPDERALLQGMVDNVLGQFKEAVATGRKLTPEAVTAIADGRVFSGSQAKALKLVDELGTLQDAIAEVAKEAGIKGKPEVIYPGASKPRWIEMLFDQRDDSDDGEDSRSSIQLTGLNSLLGNVLGNAQTAITGRTPGVYWLWSGAR
jgi:protease-4